MDVCIIKQIGMVSNSLFILLHGDHHHFTVTAPFLIGILASVMHVVSGPDHLAAVTPLAIDNKLKAWFIGLGWGIGHTLGMLLIGVVFLLFKHLIPVETISAYGEIAVGVILIAIGLWALWRVFFKAQGHHAHNTAAGHEHLMPAKQSFISAVIIGTIHGFAGVSHLLGVLPTLAFPTRFDSVMYLTGFGLGTISAMIAFSYLLGIVAHHSDERFKPIIFKSIQIAGALAALIVGIYWIFMFI